MHFTTLVLSSTQHEVLECLSLDIVPHHTIPYYTIPYHTTRGGQSPPKKKQKKLPFSANAGRHTTT